LFRGLEPRDGKCRRFGAAEQQLAYCSGLLLQVVRPFPERLARRIQAAGQLSRSFPASGITCGYPSLLSARQSGFHPGRKDHAIKLILRPVGDQDPPDQFAVNLSKGDYAILSLLPEGMWQATVFPLHKAPLDRGMFGSPDDALLLLEAETNAGGNG
jgi:hypothetical protein